MSGEQLTKQQRFRHHLIGMAVAAVLAFVLVLAINGGYWTSEPWPGGIPAKELLEERSGLKSGIENLIRIYSIPIGLQIFFSIYGAISADLEIRTALKYIIIPLFLYTVPAVIIVFFIPFLFLGGILSMILALFTGLRRKKRSKNSLKFSLLVCVHHIFSIIIAYSYGNAWFSIFGD